MSKIPHNIEELNQLYSEADQADQDIFAEQRSNILLISGDHYARKNSKYWNRIRDSKDIPNEQKLRLTKNHIQKITKTYTNNINTYAPNVVPVPKNDKELQSQKAAELAAAVWQDARDRHKLKQKIYLHTKDFIDIGETAVKIFWNPNKGKFLGYKAEMDEAGQPVMDESGQMVASKTPAFSGDFEFERIFAFNLLRSASAKNMDDSPFIIIRKMVKTAELRAMVGQDEEKLRFITESEDKTYTVFDGNSHAYKKTKDETMLREYYFRPCADYPQGYFFLTVEGGVIAEGELPFGVFPIVYAGFDEVQTSPRHRSIVKQLRPYQAEINRAASKMAEHQVTLGDDKLLVQSGTKVTNGGHLPGVRTLQYSGMEPKILSGRSGEQYLNYMNAQIDEMYVIANLKEDSAEKDGKYDAFGQLFMSMRDKKKFSIYAEKIEQFLSDWCEVYLTLARQYLPEDSMIAAVGKNEMINIQEFRQTSPLHYSIKVERQVNDITEQMGKQLVANHILQYVGPNMDKKDIGKVIRSMPFANYEEAFSDFTMDDEAATNMILALDRGEQPIPNKYDEAPYMIKRLVNRMRQADFKFLDQQVQQNYEMYKNFYEDAETQKQRQILAAQADFIPTGGARIKVDYYVPSPSNPARVERATLPAESVDWLIKRLADQGSSQEMLATLNTTAVSEMAGKLDQQQGSGVQQDTQAPIAQGMGQRLMQ